MKAFGIPRLARADLPPLRRRSSPGPRPLARAHAAQPVPSLGQRAALRLTSPPRGRRKRAGPRSSMRRSRACSPSRWPSRSASTAAPERLPEDFAALGVMMFRSPCSRCAANAAPQARRCRLLRCARCACRRSACKPVETCKSERRPRLRPAGYRVFRERQMARYMAMATPAWAVVPASSPATAQGEPPRRACSATASRALIGRFQLSRRVGLAPLHGPASGARPRRLPGTA